MHPAPLRKYLSLEIVIDWYSLTLDSVQQARETSAAPDQGALFLHATDQIEGGDAAQDELSNYGGEAVLASPDPGRIDGRRPPRTERPRWPRFLPHSRRRSEKPLGEDHCPSLKELGDNLVLPHARGLERRSKAVGVPNAEERVPLTKAARPDDLQFDRLGRDLVDDDGVEGRADQLAEVLVGRARGLPERVEVDRQAQHLVDRVGVHDGQ